MVSDDDVDHDWTFQSCQTAELGSSWFKIILVFLEGWSKLNTILL